MIVEHGNYRAKPVSNCWQLQRRTKKKETGEEYWNPMECYPNNLCRALELMLEHTMRDGDETASLEEAVERVQKAVRSLQSAAKDAMRV